MYFTEKQTIGIDYKSKYFRKDETNSRDLLLKLNDRVKKNRQVRTMKINTYPNNIEEKKALKTTRKRIDIISLLNKHTYKNGESFQLNLQEYIQKMVQYTLPIGNIKETVSIKVDDILLNNETAAHIGLILYELLTNSIKQGSKKEAKRNIYVHKKNRTLAIRVKDSENGLPDLNHKNKGNHTGMKLVQIIVQQYIGSIYTFNKGAQVVVFLNI